MGNWKHLTLDDLLADGLNEEQLVKTISKEKLEYYTPITKEIEVNPKTGLKIQAYKHSTHFDDRFDSRFVTGDEIVSNKFRKPFNKLPNWKPLTHKIFKDKLIKGINGIISQFSLERGAYFIISKSIRMITPVAILRVEGSSENKYVLIISSVFHTSMSNIDKFKWKGREYDKKDVLVEYRTYEEFEKYIFESEGVWKIEGVDFSEIDYIDKKYIELFEEGDRLYTSPVIIEVN